MFLPTNWQMQLTITATVCAWSVAKQRFWLLPWPGCSHRGKLKKTIQRHPISITNRCLLLVLSPMILVHYIITIYPWFLYHGTGSIPHDIGSLYTWSPIVSIQSPNAGPARWFQGSLPQRRLLRWDESGTCDSWNSLCIYRWTLWTLTMVHYYSPSVATCVARDYERSNSSPSQYHPMNWELSITVTTG